VLIDDQGTADAAWSHNGRFIVYDGNRANDHPVLAVVNADGTGRRELFAPPGAGAVDPFWSPDDTRVVFQSDKDGNEDLYVINADGSGLRRVTNDPARDNIPVW
jgi:TolB protein